MDGTSDWLDPRILAAARRFAVMLVGVADADDLVQDALARAWRKRATFDAARGSMTSWVLAIVADVRRQQVRALSRRATGWPELPELSARSPDARLDLRAAVNALSKAQREAVILFYYVDLSVADVAALLDRSPGTIKSTLSDARRALGKSLGADYARS